MPIIMDFEASGLNIPNSYPIQVALLDTETNDSYCSYIEPDESWTYWSEESFAIHNIPRQLLFDVGKYPRVVAVEMMDFLHKHGQKTVYCDAPQWDAFWLDQLFDAACLDSTCIEVEHVVELIKDTEDLNWESVWDLINYQERTHHALDDCHSIYEVLGIIGGDQ